MYSGYTNKPTWIVAQWLYNDEEIYSHFLEHAKRLFDDTADPDFTAQALSVEIASFIENLPRGSVGWIADLLEWSLEAVVWGEVASDFVGEIVPGFVWRTKKDTSYDEYQGLANYPTYVLLSLFQGDYEYDPEGIQTMVRRKTEDAAFEGSMNNFSTAFVLADKLRDICNTAVGSLLDAGHLSITAASLVNHALDVADWNFLAKTIAESHGLGRAVYGA